MNGHELYETGDPGVPDQILDRNGEVVLGLCKRCGKAEIELEEPCTKPHMQVLEWPKLTKKNGAPFAERKAKRIHEAEQDWALKRAADLARELHIVLCSSGFTSFMARVCLYPVKQNDPEAHIDFDKLKEQLRRVGALNDEVMFDDSKPVAKYEQPKLEWDSPLDGDE